LTPLESEEYPTKAEAKKAVARQAVLWLRRKGEPVRDVFMGQVSTMPSMKGFTHATDVSPFSPNPNPNHTGLTQVLKEIDINTLDKGNLPQQVARLALELGFTQPSFETHPCVPKTVRHDQTLTGFIDISARFSEKDVKAEPRLAGALGTVKEVYGKKKAKEECCREVLRVLDAIARDRLRGGG
jgi:hypothetical protein